MPSFPFNPRKCLTFISLISGALQWAKKSYCKEPAWVSRRGEKTRFISQLAICWNDKILPFEILRILLGQLRSNPAKFKSTPRHSHRFFYLSSLPVKIEGGAIGAWMVQTIDCWEWQSIHTAQSFYYLYGWIIAKIKNKKNHSDWRRIITTQIITHFLF